MSNYDVLNEEITRLDTENKALVVDNARLRALVRAKEWVGSCCYDAFCPWCGDISTYDQRITGHAADCPAFTPDGKVK